MKIIFLDIDGVLCTTRSHLAFSKSLGGEMDAWDVVATNVIRKCCAFPDGPRLVISSAWRRFCQNPYDNSDILGVRLAETSLAEYLHQDWKTRTLAFRGKEVREWLSRHTDATDYRVIDDIMWDMEEIDKHKLFQTDFDNGISGEQMRRLIQWSSESKDYTISIKKYEQ